MLIDRKTYWRRQLRRTLALLVIWAVVGFGMSILFVEELNKITLGDMPFGFWMAQQGSIYVFILLILAYALLSGKADRDAGLDTLGDTNPRHGPTATHGPDHPSPSPSPSPSP